MCTNWFTFFNYKTLRLLIVNTFSYPNSSSFIYTFPCYIPVKFNYLWNSISCNWNNYNENRVNRARSNTAIYASTLKSQQSVYSCLSHSGSLVVPDSGRNWCHFRYVELKSLTCVFVRYSHFINSYQKKIDTVVQFRINAVRIRNS